MGPTNIFHLQDLEKKYGDRFNLRIDDLTIEQGGIFAVIGPSGSGKSTLLRLLNFLEAPSKGIIRFRDREIHAGDDVPLDLRRRVTTVFQQPVLLNRSVWSNVAFGLKLQGASAIDQRVRSGLESMGLSDLARQPARMLSGGEAQRVALARALLLKPDVLLLDEPTANLDPYNVALTERIIEQSIRELGTTIVLVTHNLFQARRLAQRAVLLMDGEIIHTGEMDDFFDKPTNSEVKAFITGEMVY